MLLIAQETLPGAFPASIDMISMDQKIQ